MAPRVTLNRTSARPLRHGGGDAMAALDAAPGEAIETLSGEMHGQVARWIGRTTAEVMAQSMHPAIRACPVSRPGERTWREVARQRVRFRAGSPDPC